MSTLIRIKRSGTAGDPSVLGDGVLAYSAANYGSVAGGGRLYIGYGAETGGDAATHIVIGGQYFTDMMDHAKGTLTADSAIITDSNNKIDILNIDNITINGNTISSTNGDGNIILAPNGAGLISASSTRIINVADPVNAQDVVTKAYLEGTVNLEYFQDDIGAMIAGGTQGGIAVTYDDANDAINFDVNDFTVTLGTGPISGSFTITDLANATFNTTLDNDSVTLGTHTTGNYVASLVAGTGVTLANNTGEGATPTIAIGQAVGTTDNVTFADLSATNVTISGDLTVSGTTTTISAQNLSVSDNMIYLNQGSEATITGASGDGTDVTYTTSGHNYVVGMSVDVSGVTPSSFNVSNETITAVSGDDFTISSSNTDTYVSGGTARAKTNINPDLGWAAGYNDGTYAHAGVFRDATDGKFKFFDSYVPEPDADVFIDTSDATFALAEVQASTFYGALSGNATTASALQTARTIALSGDVVGSISFDGSGNVDISTAIQANSVALGTDTTGNYVATIADAGNSNITVANSGTETAAVTLDLTSTGVSVGSYGSATAIPTFTVDTYGRLTAAGSVNIATTLNITDGSNSDGISLLTETLTFTGGTGLTATVGTNQVTFDLDNTAVTPGTYGSASAVSSFTVDAQGRITNASNTNISIVSTAVTDFAEAAQDAVGAAIAAGTQTNVTVAYDDANNKIDYTVATATSSVLGVAKFSTDNFTVATGNVTVTAIDGGTY